MLDRYAALHRAKSLLHVYLKDGERGYWGLYNKERMKYLWVKGRKYMEYSSQKFRIFGRFNDLYTINEEKYRQKKREVLNRKRFTTRADVYKEQRDALLYLMHKELGVKHTQIAIMCKKWGFNIARNTISEIIAEKSKEMLKVT